MASSGYSHFFDRGAPDNRTKLASHAKLPNIRSRRRAGGRGPNRCGARPPCLNRGVGPHEETMKLTVLILLSMPLIVSASQQRPIPRQETQLGMNETTGKELEAAETEMAKVLDSLMKKAAGKADAIANLNKSQS